MKYLATYYYEYNTESPKAGSRRRPLQAVREMMHIMIQQPRDGRGNLQELTGVCMYISCQTHTTTTAVLSQRGEAYFREHSVLSSSLK